MPLTISRRLWRAGRPPRLGAGTSGSRIAHSASRRSLGYGLRVDGVSRTHSLARLTIFQNSFSGQGEVIVGETPADAGRMQRVHVLVRQVEGDGDGLRLPVDRGPGRGAAAHADVRRAEE